MGGGGLVKWVLGNEIILFGIYCKNNNSKTQQHQGKRSIWGRNKQNAAATKKKNT